ncbi:MAG: hypothetical protein ACRDJ9_18375 [Dehalococcoidia bacterium]
MGNQRAHNYEVRPSIGGPPVVSVTVDRQAGILTATLAGSRTVRLNALEARAMWIVIHEAVYEQRSLRLEGPTLTLTYDRGTGRAVIVRRNS